MCNWENFPYEDNSSFSVTGGVWMMPSNLQGFGRDPEFTEYELEFTGGALESASSAKKKQITC